MPKTFKDASMFHRLLILRAIRPDRLTNALNLFVSENLGSEFVEQPPFNMEQTYLEMKPHVPIFFVLFPGVDPTVDVEQIGQKYGFTSDNQKFINISMGQGQEEIAIKALKESAKEGKWIMLQNVHLMQKWMKQFEREFEAVCEDVHDDFRCSVCW